MVLNEFTRALHEDELGLADKFQDTKGTDWDGYFKEKEKAGFMATTYRTFLEMDHIDIQIESKYKTPVKRTVKAVFFNNRRVGVELRVCSLKEGKAAKTCDIPAEGYEDTSSLEEWISEILVPFQPVGYGVHFRANVDTSVMERAQPLFDILEKAKFSIVALTVFWFEHDKMCLILHDDAHFCDY